MRNDVYLCTKGKGQNGRFGSPYMIYGIFNIVGSSNRGEWMRLLFHNRISLFLKFNPLINCKPPIQSPHYSPFRFTSFSWSNSSKTSTNYRSIISTPPMATANSKPPPPTHHQQKLPLPLPTAKIDGEVGVAGRCWIKCKREWTLSLYSPFVVSLAAGNLDLDAFRHYIGQDIHFLKSFARAYELAEECADDDDAKLAIRKLRKDVLEELKMHNSFVQEWEFDVVKESSLNPAIVTYTKFLLATASGKVEGLKAPGKLATPFERTKVAAYTLGAMTPCMRLYAFLGKELLALLDDSEHSHPYKKWIANYASESFQASALLTEDILEKLSVSLTGEELDVIEKLYQQAMKLELGFFLAQPLVQRTAVPLSKELKGTEDHLMLFSDFDLTCSVIDSSAILAEIAIVTAPKTDQTHSGDQLARMSSADLKTTWLVLSKHYTEEYEQSIESILLTPKAEKFDHEGLQKALEQVSDFEKKANLRVIESGVLKGLNLEDIKRAGKRLILQDGCTQFFQSIIKRDNLSVNVHVLSYCWCADLIRSALSSGGLDVLKVHANELAYENGISTGEISVQVESPIDKAQAFSTILQKSGNDKRKLTVYIGDSVGDLLCLLKADIGIVIGTSSSLRRLGTHFGVSFVPLFPGVVDKQKEHVGTNKSVWKGLSGTLYTVSSWSEIHAFVLGS